MSVLVVAPTSREARAVPGARPCGAGAEAAQGLARLLDALRPSAVVVVGVCGGLDPSLVSGDVVLARSLVSRGQLELRPPMTAFDAVRREFRRRGLPFVSSRLLTVDRPAAATEEKVDLWNEFGAAGVDMESYPLGSLLAARGVPWLVVRVVLDPAGSRLPPSLAAWQRESDGGAALRTAALRPWEWLDYVRLARAWPRAARSLRRASRVAARSLASAPVEELPVVPSPPG